jgi:hypothetical protein
VCEAADAFALVLTQIGELAGLAVGATVLLNVLVAGYARSRDQENSFVIEIHKTEAEYVLIWPTGPSQGHR